MEDLKRETTPIYDDAFIEHELDKQNLSVYEADIRKESELLRVRHTCNQTHRFALQKNATKKPRRTRHGPTSDDDVLRQAPELPDDYEPFNENGRKTLIHAQQSDEGRTAQVCATVQQNEFEWIRDVATTTCHIRPRRENTAAPCSQSDHEPDMEHCYSTTERAYTAVQSLARCNSNYEHARHTTIADAIKTSMGTIHNDNRCRLKYHQQQQQQLQQCYDQPRRDWINYKCTRLAPVKQLSTVGYLGNDQTEVKLHWKSLLPATVLESTDCANVDYTQDLESLYYEWYDDFKQENMVYEHHEKIYNQSLSMETTYLEMNQNKKRAYHEHSKTPKCIRKEQTTTSSERTLGGLHKQSITQIDYAFLKSDSDRHNATVLPMCESTTGPGNATMVPYKGIDAEALKAQAHGSLWKTDYKPLSYNLMENLRSLNC
eukprot:3801657-Amphidinium_carterae.1